MARCYAEHRSVVVALVAIDRNQTNFGRVEFAPMVTTVKGSALEMVTVAVVMSLAQKTSLVRMA